MDSVPRSTPFLGLADLLARDAIGFEKDKTAMDEDKNDDGLSLSLGRNVALQKMTDLEEKYIKNIRPLLDAVDKLRDLKVMNEGIPLPTIVVVGDQSSGKSSVLESLATISLPRGHGIATRVPLVLRLQSCQSGESSIVISYKDKKFSITEDNIKFAVDAATVYLAGSGKGVTDTPISLHIRKPNAPDLTMIDLPGITRVPVDGQPENIYEQIATMIRHYLKPEQTVILNVLSATVDFTTCESISMSRQEDKDGKRTLAVVTKVDRAPEGVYEKVTGNDVKIGLGYVCVRNRTDEDESHDKARRKEKELFRIHPSLSKLPKGCVGIPALAERLTLIQANIMRSSLPGIEKLINNALEERLVELKALPTGLLAGEDPTNAFHNVINDNKDYLQEIVLKGNYQRFAQDNYMHYPARLVEKFEKFNNQLDGHLAKILLPRKTEEIVTRMAEMKGLYLPNFLSPTLMAILVREEIDKVKDFCMHLVSDTHDYATAFVLELIAKSTSAFPNLQQAYKEGAENVLADSRDSCYKFVERVLTKETSTVFTMNDIYMVNVNKIQESLRLLKASKGNAAFAYAAADIVIDGFGTINIGELYQKTNQYESAWHMKINLAAYWKVVHKRMADDIPLELRFSIESALLQDLPREIWKAKSAGGVSHLMEEHAANLEKKTKLQKRVEVLKECKKVVHALYIG